MTKLRGLRLASHFGPTLIVTTIGFSFSTYYRGLYDSILIAFGIFTGQLVVGWSNDLYDLKDDLRHNRLNKPLVSGLITESYLRKWLVFMLPFSFAANLYGPLGVRGGLVYMFGIGWGVAYNYYFKFSLLSPLPYTFAFAALPSCVVISKGLTPPLWMWAGGALFGTAAHFINVLKDMKQDHESGIKGLPQRLGKNGSIALAAVLTLLGIFVVL